MKSKSAAQTLINADEMTVPPGALSPTLDSVHDSIGFVELTPQFDVLAANKTAIELCGVKPEACHSAVHLLGQNVIALLRALLDGEIGTDLYEHEIELVRADGRRAPVAIAARSTVDVGGGTNVFVTIRSLVAQRAIKGLLDAARSATTAQEIFHAMAEEICRWIPFTHCGGSIYSENLTQARVVFGHGPVMIKWPNRWFDLTPAGAEWLKQAKRQAIPDLQEFHSDPRWQATRDPATVQAIAQLKSSFRVPVVQNDSVIGSVNFFRDHKDGFRDPYDLELLYALPIDHVFLMAVSQLENEDFKFHEDLRKQLSKQSYFSGLNKSLSELIVKCISQHYGWESVSLFQVNRETQRFELQTQIGQHSPPLDKDFSLGLQEGLMGKAYKTGTPLCISDLSKTDQPYVQGHAFPALSDLCLPLRVGGDIIGMLNIEDPQKNAFSDKAINTISALLGDICSQLERQRNETIINAAFQWTPTALFVATENGRLEKVNPTATQMLGYEEGELEGKSLDMILEPSKAVQALVRINNAFRNDVSVIRKDGKRVPVSVASSRLGEMMGSIVAARDLTSQKRIEELEGLERIFYDIAAQTKVPLAMAFSWLTKLRNQFEASPADQAGQAAQDLDKVIRQLRRVEITYDHLALYDKNAIGGIEVNPVMVETGRLLNTLMSELPSHDTDRIQIGGDGLKALFLADVYQVSFVLISLLFYGLRFLPESQKLVMNVRLTHDARRAWVEFNVGALVPAPQKPSRRKIDLFISRVITDISLGTPALKAFVQANGGRLDLPDRFEKSIQIRVAFPVAHTAA